MLYYSKTGNTKKLAEAVAKGVLSVNGVECIIKSTDEVKKDDFVKSKGIIAGSPVYFGTMASQLKEVFDTFLGVRSKMEDCVGGAFTTSADPTGGKETTIMSIIQAMLIYGMVFAGDPLDATGHYGVGCTGAPDEKAIENAQKLGNRIALLAKKIHS